MKKLIYSLLICSGLMQKAQAQGGFTKIVNAANPATTFTTNGVYKGCAWIDLDNDHDLDLFAAPNRLFRNDSAGVFVALPNLPFTAQQNPGGASWADLDNDGDIDVVVAQKPSGVYLNDGQGNFTSVGAQIDSLNAFPSWGCAIGNWNNDAYPDFIFAHAANFHVPGPFPSKLYLNTNNSVHPAYVSGYEITNSTGPYTVPYWSDYDLDGDMDLFVATGPGGSPGPDFCYKNLKVESGKDTLSRLTTELFASQLQDGQCYNFVDADHDGDLDLCLTNYAGAQSRFYVNTNGSYALRTMPFTQTAQNLTNDWGDFDNDGDLDVIITNDAAPAKLYKNNGALNFSTAISLGAVGACGVSNGDMDNDGDLDLFLHGLTNSRALFRNDSANQLNWVNIKCEGIVSNKSALGTIVKLKATINGNSYWQIREISAQNSFQSQNDLRVHFGLGNANSIDSLIIRYPSGITDVLSNLAVNQFYCHDEGSAGMCVVSTGNAIQAPDPMNIYPNPAADFISVNAAAGWNEIDAWSVYDVQGKEVLFSKSKCSLPLKISLSKLTAGTYWLQVKHKSLVNSFSFVKE